SPKKGKSGRIVPSAPYSNLTLSSTLRLGAAHTATPEAQWLRAIHRPSLIQFRSLRRSVSSPCGGKIRAAQVLDVEPRTLEDPEFLKAIGLPVVRLGRLVRFRPADVREVIERALSK